MQGFKFIYQNTKCQQNLFFAKCNIFSTFGMKSSRFHGNNNLSF